MRQADSQRLDRLVGDGISGAGIDLASLFRVILDQVQDRADGVEAAALNGPVRNAVSNHARVEHWYGARAADPWSALISDALEQLESRKLVVRDGDRWRIGPAFATGRRLTVIPARKGKHGSVGVIPYNAVEREARGLAEKLRMEITSLAASLRETGPGLRPLDSHHVAALEQSMRDYGYRPELPPLVDQHGRILDGRHRIAAARRAGVTVPPPRQVTVASDEEAVGFAILVNLQRGWTKDERKRIDSDLRAADLTVENFGRRLGPAAKTELIAVALREHPDWSHTRIAKTLGVHPEQVGSVCQEVTQDAGSECTHGAVSQGARPDLALGGPRYDPESAAHLEQHQKFDQQVNQLRAQGRTQRQIAQDLGVTFNRVQDSWQREEGRRQVRAEIARELDWAVRNARNALNEAKFSDRGQAEDPQQWPGAEGELYRTLKELAEAAEGQGFDS
jgi:hypothetical protein